MLFGFVPPPSSSTFCASCNNMASMQLQCDEASANISTIVFVCLCWVSPQHFALAMGGISNCIEPCIIYASRTCHTAGPMPHLSGVGCMRYPSL